MAKRGRKPNTEPYHPTPQEGNANMDVKVHVPWGNKYFIENMTQRYGIGTELLFWLCAVYCLYDSPKDFRDWFDNIFGSLKVRRS